MMGLLLLLHLGVGLAVIAAGAPLGRRALPIAALPSLVSVAWLVTRLPDVLDGGVITESVRWVPQLGLALDLRLDGFAALMVLLVSGIGVLVFTYAH
jgi:NADH:ubiquinone oxidoreductase subunit 5 (subunit L)/multisubunit Na+/H+ antiporter MnhA subunit